ncbi:MAG: prolyl oligopeptidase family serine peptidase [Lentimicrobiaceae bacterium]
MRYLTITVVIILTILMMSCNNKTPVQEKIKYPATKKVTQTDNYFGTQVADPYRWLENDTSAETADWVIAQNKVTDGYLSKIPFRDQIHKRLETLWNYAKLTVPFKKGDWIFFQKNDGMQNQSVVYVQKGISGEPRVLLDPNTLSADGTVAVGNLSVSHDGKYMAYSLNKAGSDWAEFNVLDIATGKNLPDKIEWVKFSGASWQGDGFYYSRYDAPSKGKELSNRNEYHKVYFHKIGTPQSDDKLIFENRNFPLRYYYATTTEDEHFLILSESEGTSGNSLFCKDLTSEGTKFVKLAAGFENDYNVVDNIGDKLLVLTNDGAPNRKLVLIDPKSPASANWKELIPEKEDVLEEVVLAGNQMFAGYMKDATNRVYAFDMEGKQLDELPLPGLGALTGFNGEKADNTVFYGFTSFTFPTTIYTYDVLKKTSAEFFKPKLDFDASVYETKQVFYESKDKTKIPMFIVHKKGLKLNGENPVFLYGYGGFNISLTPNFNVSRLIFLENGGVYCMPNLRGGGEYGEKWHEAGTKLNKQNVFDDFIAAAEYLIHEKYTTSEKLAISGGSNGGLLIGACMTQRPELFKVCLPAVGVMDMLRYHKFTVGWGWASDYGTSDDSTQFRNLLSYSPLYNIKDSVCYPATLITTGDHDDRVVPAHSFKFAATLQAKQGCDNPVLIRIETKAGHGAGKPTAKIIDEAADMYSFLFYNLGIKPIK